MTSFMNAPLAKIKKSELLLRNLPYILAFQNLHFKYVSCSQRLCAKSKFESDIKKKVFSTNNFFKLKVPIKQKLVFEFPPESMKLGNKCNEKLI